jgi:hypothetical protein
MGRLRAQYTGGTNSNLATIRKHLTNRKLGTSIAACLYSDESIRINTFTSKQQVNLGRFKNAVEAIIKDAGVAVKKISYRSTFEINNFTWYTRIAILEFGQEVV